MDRLMATNINSTIFQAEWRMSLEIVNYLSTLTAMAIAGVDLLKTSFSPPDIVAL